MRKQMKSKIRVQNKKNLKDRIMLMRRKAMKSKNG